MITSWNIQYYQKTHGQMNNCGYQSPAGCVSGSSQIKAIFHQVLSGGRKMKPIQFFHMYKEEGAQSQQNVEVSKRGYNGSKQI